MEIIKYAGKDCVKCKMLEQVFKRVTLPCEVQTRYVEDESTETFFKEGVDSLPTVVVKNATDSIKLSGIISPKQINEAIERLK